MGIATLSPPAVMALTQQPLDRLQAPTAGLLASVSLYAQRGGGVETASKGDQQGLGITKRNKQGFVAQPMVTHLKALAHNTIVWARPWLTPYVPTVNRWGRLRMVREVFHVRGRLVFDHWQSLSSILLNPADPLATGLATGLGALLKSEHIAVTLGES